MTHNDKAAVSTLIRELADSMKASKRFQKRTFEPPLALDIEAHLAAKYRDTPPAISDELRAKLGSK